MKTCFFVVFLIHFATCKINLGNMVNLCDVRDPKIDDCFLRAANDIMPFLVKGIEEFDMPVLDPLKIPKMDFGQNMGPLTLQLNLYDTVQRGLSTLVFDSAKMDLENGVLELNGTILHYDVQGRYIGKGKLLLFPIAGDGKADFSFNNTKIYIHAEIEPELSGDDYYLKLKSFNVSYAYDKVKISLSHLFSDNKRLADAAYRFINQNSKEVLSGIQGPLAENYAKIFSTIIRKFFAHVPITELFKNL